jgi:hypothetical protein
MSQRRAIPVFGVFLIVLLLVCWLVQSQREVVHNSFWDGSVAQVKLFLRHNWLDIGPRPPVDWGKVEKTPDGDFLVPCTFYTRVQGKPAILAALFTFDSRGQYIDVKSTTRARES